MGNPSHRRKGGKLLHSGHTSFDMQELVRARDYQPVLGPGQCMTSRIIDVYRCTRPRSWSRISSNAAKDQAPQVSLRDPCQQSLDRKQHFWFVFASVQYLKGQHDVHLSVRSFTSRCPAAPYSLHGSSTTNLLPFVGAVRPGPCRRDHVYPKDRHLPLLSP